MAFVTTYEDGSNAFESNIVRARPEHQPELHRLVQWAKSLEQAQLASLRSTIGNNRWVLKPYLNNQGKTGIVTIWNDPKGPALDINLSVMEKWSPHCIGVVELALGHSLVNKSSIREIDDRLLNAIHDAYVEAHKGTSARRRS